MNNIKNVIHEFKLIKWCGLKEWIKSSLIVLLIGIIMALLLTGFDVLSAYIMTFVHSGNFTTDGTVKTIVQICLFIISIILLIVTFLQSNKGKDVLSGIASSGIELFAQTKEVGSDRTLTKIIVILMIITFGLNIIEGIL